MFRKSSYSNSQGACVEVGSSDRQVLVRDTTNRSGTTLAISYDTWVKFTVRIRGGKD